MRLYIARAGLAAGADRCGVDCRHRGECHRHNGSAASTRRRIHRTNQLQSDCFIRRQNFVWSVNPDDDSVSVIRTDTDVEVQRFRVDRSRKAWRLIPTTSTST